MCRRTCWQCDGHGVCLKEIRQPRPRSYICILHSPSSPQLKWNHTGSRTLFSPSQNWVRACQMHCDRPNEFQERMEKKLLYFYRELWKIDYNICVPHVISFNINWPLSAIMFELFVVHMWESTVCPLDGIFAIIHIINVTLPSTLRFAPQHDNSKMHLVREPCGETYSAPAVSIEDACPCWITWALAS